jgi:Fur family transcriptional regulator, ferric uptake regulator
MSTRGCASPPFEPVRGAEWAGIPERLRARGLRWTPQRRVLIEVLSQTDGHVTGAELVERCRAIEPGTIPSTVYRTIDVLEGLGVLSHSHGADGQEEFHVLPQREHGHLYCRSCARSWDLEATDRAIVAASAALRDIRGFEVDLSHVTLSGLCAACQRPGA